MKERLQKILAQAGVCSRRASEPLIQSGRVTVNGRRASLGDKADCVRDYICIDGKPIGKAECKTVLMLHKPRGFVTTMHDEKGRRDVSQLVADCGVRVYPVGRLDYDSEGLLLMTNDGELAYKLTHPGHEVNKQYFVSVRGPLDRLSKLSEPMEIDGYQIQAAKVVVLRQEGDRAVIRMTIHEGRNRQIRKMCKNCGLVVKRLKRETVGPIRLDETLPAGKWRKLTEKELAMLAAL